MKISRQIFDLFLGNKSDLDDRREVTESTAAQFAAEKGMAYIETSARDSANIREAFLTLVKPRLRLNRAASTATTWSNTLKKQKSYTRHSKTLILKKEYYWCTIYVIVNLIIISKYVFWVSVANFDCLLSNQNGAKLKDQKN